MMKLLKIPKTLKKCGSYKEITLVLIVLFSGSLSLKAQDHNNYSRAATAIPLLRICPDTRTAALGETSIATLPGAASGMLNTSKAIFAQEQDAFMIDYTPWLREIISGEYVLSLAGYKKLDENQAITASLRYLNAGQVEERDNNNNLLQLVTPSEFILDAGYARKLSEKLSVGATFRFIHSAIGKTINNASGAANAVSADLSAFYSNLDRTGRGLTAGLVISNLGTGRIKYGKGDNFAGFLPATIGAGLGYSLPIDNDNQLRFSGDFTKSLVPLIPLDDNDLNKIKDYNIMESYGKGLGNNALSFSIGAEYLYKKFLALRTGYYRESNSYGGRKYLSAGAGIYYRKVGINFAYIIPSGKGINRNVLSNTFRLGFYFSPHKSTSH